MARVHGKDLTSCNVDDSGGTARDLLAETTAIDFKESSESHDTTTMGDDWREAVGGLKGGDEFTHEVFYNNAAVASGGTYLLYHGRLGIVGTFAFGDGTVTTSMETLVTSVSSPVAVGDMMKVTATHKITGAVSAS